MVGRIHTLMLPVRGDGKGDNVLAHAAAVARRFNAHVRVVHCRPKAEDLMPFGVVVPAFMRKEIEEIAKKNATSVEEGMRDEFHKLIDTFQLSEEAPSQDKATACFLEYEGKQVDAVRHFGRLADLVCVAKPDRSRNIGENTLKSALYSSGRPVMMCPDRETAPESIGNHVAIGWNGSLEATKALAQAMPLIETAGKVTILTTGGEPHAATAEELKDYLALRGVTAEINRFEHGRSIGRDLLQHCDKVGADLLIMGAYHDSYERETILGGNTQVVVDEAKIPVVLVH